MSNFLDKLAMECDTWDSAMRMAMFEMGPPKKGEFVTVKASEEQWLQRRKELTNEPDDSDAPEWAKWKAQDRDGAWYWYDREPSDGVFSWTCRGDVGLATQGKTPAGHDWRDTLKEVKRLMGKEINLNGAVSFMQAKRSAHQSELQRATYTNTSSWRQGVQIEIEKTIEMLGREYLNKSARSEFEHHLGMMLEMLRKELAKPCEKEASND